MDRNQSYEEQRDAKLGEIATDKALLIISALKAGSELNTKMLMQDVSEFLADDQALAQLIRETALGSNAFFDLLNKLIWQNAERQAEDELKAQARYNRDLSTTDRIHRYLDRIAA